MYADDNHFTARRHSSHLRCLHCSARFSINIIEHPRLHAGVAAIVDAPRERPLFVRLGVPFWPRRKTDVLVGVNRPSDWPNASHLLEPSPRSPSQRPLALSLSASWAR